MSDSTNPLDQISTTAIQRETTANANFDAASPAMIFGRRASTSAGLTFGYYGGRLNGTSVANGTVLATNAATNYVVVDLATLAVSVSTSNSNWNATTSYGRMYLLTAAGGAITAYEDHRAGVGGILLGGAGAGGTPTGTGFRHVTGGVEDGAAVAVDLSSAHATGTLAAGRFPALTGDVTNSAGSLATTIANNAVITAKINAGAVTNAKLDTMAAHTFKGNNTGSTATPVDMTATQATAELNALVGDSGSGGTKGLAPAPAAGDAAAGKYLKADGTYAVPPGTGSGSSIVISPSYTGTDTVDLSSYATYATVIVRLGTLTGNTTFNITNGTDGQVVRVRFTQDGSGNRTFTPGANIRMSADIPSITLSTTGAKVDKVAFEWDGTAGKADVLAVNKGF